jgi:DNA-directed RNA polymerase subunit beta'
MAKIRQAVEAREAEEFNAIRIGIASPEEVLSWSHGEITKPETINYRTLKPEKDGLFCERIFGPERDYECYCGKYKKIRYKGVVCDKCGVEVTRSIVRRERMGHIKLAVPVTHIWYLRGIPSSLGLVLGLSVRDLEKVVYFISYIVTDVNEEARKNALENLEKEFKEKKAEIVKTTENEVERNEKVFELEESRNLAKDELEGLAKNAIISELNYRNFSMKYGDVFKASIGAEAIGELLSGMDLVQIEAELRNEVNNTQGQKRKKALKRLKMIQGLSGAKLRPEWMIIHNLPLFHLVYVPWYS